MFLKVILAKTAITGVAITPKRHTCLSGAIMVHYRTVFLDAAPCRKAVVIQKCDSPKGKARIDKYCQFFLSILAQT